MTTISNVFAQENPGETPEAKAARLEFTNRRLVKKVEDLEANRTADTKDLQALTAEKSAAREIQAIKRADAEQTQKQLQAAKRNKRILKGNLLWPGYGHLSEGFKYRGGLYAVAFPIALAATYFSNQEVIRRSAAVDRAFYEAPFQTGERVNAYRSARIRAGASLGLSVAVFAVAVLDASLHGGARPGFLAGAPGSFESGVAWPALSFTNDSFMARWDFSL